MLGLRRLRTQETRWTITRMPDLRFIVESSLPEQLWCSAKTAAKWVSRFREQGAAGLRDRSSRPRHVRQPTSAELVERVEVLRRQRWTGFRIARQTGLSRATVSRILRRLKLSRVRDLEPRPVFPRYEHAAPGDLLHLDIKKLGRIVRPSHRVTGNRRDSASGAGWEYVHVAIDDHSRIAFSALHPNEKADSTVAFLHQALLTMRGLASSSGPSSPTMGRPIAREPSPWPAERWD